MTISLSTTRACTLPWVSMRCVADLSPELGMTDSESKGADLLGRAKVVSLLVDAIFEVLTAT